ncbi:hypothetical protein KY284_005378 [Solanum tuberosum]|nr:hypothetical protein KY284_005378 [Solanum tuberosum]
MAETVLQHPTRSPKPVEVEKTPSVMEPSSQASTSQQSTNMEYHRGTPNPWPNLPLKSDGIKRAEVGSAKLNTTVEKAQQRGEEKGKETWTNLFQSNKLAAKGMKLNFVAPVMQNGEKVVKLYKEEVDLETNKWKHTIILYVVGASPTIASLERYIANQWNYIAKPTVYYHNDVYFLLRFPSLEDRNAVMYSGPHLLNNKPVIVKTWTPNFDLSKEVLQTIPFWGKSPNLPLNCWGMQSLSKISRGLGFPLYADECTTKVARISFERVLIELDITKDLSFMVKEEDPNGKKYEQKVIYEWIPAYCPKCLQVGHKCPANNPNAGPVM